MLDSGGMSKSEDKPPTLASLRARRGRVRTSKRPSSGPRRADSFSQAGLFSVLSETGVVLDDEPVESVTLSEKSTQAAEEPRLKSIPIPSAVTERRTWNVRELVTNIRQHVEITYTDLWVEGEISNFRPAPSGHIYFTLKDGEAQLPVVLFRRQASILRFRLTDGLAVLVRGRVSVYESRGQLQLIGETVEPRGAGALQLAFEQLKARLLAEGLFDAERKRPLPTFPKCIGIITSPTGAVDPRYRHDCAEKARKIKPSRLSSDHAGSIRSLLRSRWHSLVQRQPVACGCHHHCARWRIAGRPRRI